MEGKIVRITSLFTVDIITSVLGIGTCSDKVEYLALRSHNLVMEQAFKPLCDSRLSNAAPHSSPSVFPALHILSDQLMVVGLIIQFMIQWMRDKLGFCLLESCCLL